MTPAIAIRRITKTFDASATPVLKGINLDVSAGECVMLVGPSGSGKTTLLSVLGCVLRPTSGTYELFGREMSQQSEGEMSLVRRAVFGFIFQGHNLISSMTAEENVLFQLHMRGIAGASARLQARTLLSRLGLEAKRDELPKALSGGERQRVAVARALAGNPRLVLADEPTASLDLENGLRVMEELKALAIERRHTVIVVTHDARIFKFADRIEHLENGQLIRNEEASIPSIRISNFWVGGGR